VKLLGGVRSLIIKGVLDQAPSPDEAASRGVAIALGVVGGLLVVTGAIGPVIFIRRRSSVVTSYSTKSDHKSREGDSL
jgi:nitrate reductase gamma subunit